MPPRRPASRPPDGHSDHQLGPWRQEHHRPAQPVGLPSDTDVAVVGAGLAGLALAHRLKQRDPGLRVAVLEARHVGAGATGMSTGVAGPGVGGDICYLTQRFGPDTAARMFRATQQAVEDTISLVASTGANCDLTISGQVLAAHTREHLARLTKQATAFSQAGIDVPLLNAEQVRQRLAGDHFLGALLYPRVATLDPWKLCQALHAKLTGQGVTVLEHTPVRRVLGGPRPAVQTDCGTLHSRHVVVATDGYSASLGVLPNRVLPLDTHVLCTEPLDEPRLQALGWTCGDVIVDSRNFFSYVRLAPDRRVVMGGGRIAYRTGRTARDHQDSEQAWTRVERELRTLLPTIGDLPVQRRWYGTTGATLDRLPVVGQLPSQPNVWFAGAWCGHGIALSAGTATQLADVLLESRDPAELGLPWWRGSAPAVPPPPLRGVGVRNYIRLLDAADRRLDRRQFRRQQPEAALAARQG